MLPLLATAIEKSLRVTSMGVLPPPPPPPEVVGVEDDPPPPLPLLPPQAAAVRASAAARAIGRMRRLEMIFMCMATTSPSIRIYDADNVRHPGVAVRLRRHAGRLRGGDPGI